jgi:phenylalanyl-tRNA synthetase alpha chain
MEKTHWSLPSNPEDLKIFWTAFADELEKIFREAQSQPFHEVQRQKGISQSIVEQVMKSLPAIPKELKKEAGMMLNQRKQLESERWMTLLESSKPREKSDKLDTTLPGRKPFVGSYHPLTIVLREITDICINMGFRVVDGPEIELVHYNFDLLNFPAWHSTRDESDTFYLPNGFVVRTETSPVQIRTMELHQPPIRIISPGRVYRRDRPDATHSPMFHQIEGLYVDEGVTMADLKGTLLSFYRQLYSKHTKLRFRPHYFPFTEPSAEVDVTCIFCKGSGCRVCKSSGWLEMGGCGMVDPKVLEGVNYDTEKYTGYAFGLGIDRIAMLRFGLDNIRLLFDSDVRFLRQFAGM